MKKMNFSLILKITGIVFIAFAIVLGNEIRLGIDRYIKNTLETDAEATIRNMDKFSKSLMELTGTKTLDLNSTSFEKIYSSALSMDTAKVKCLVDEKGKILDISREGIGDPTVCLIVNDYKGSNAWPAYFNLTSLDEDSIDTVESRLLEGEEESQTMTMEIEFVNKNPDEIGEFSNIEIKVLKLNDVMVFENKKVKGSTETISGPVNTYISYNVEIMYPTSVVENLKSSISLNEETADSTTPAINEPSQPKALVLDYKNAMEGLEEQVKKNYSKFKSTAKSFISTNYANYYLLNPYEYEGKQYSTVMVKLIDWNRLTQQTSAHMSEEEQENAITAGILFVTQEYDHLQLKAFQQFMLDNSSTYLLAFLLIILICLAIAYMIIKPIRRIETTAKHIARKEFDYPIDMTRHDELGDLARSIDTMSKELEKTINSLYQEVERVQKMEVIRKDFVSNFTHEIKTPLGIINGFSELVEIEQDEAKRNGYIEIIQNETHKINELVLAMLDLSKLESQNITLTKENIDLLDIVDECIDSLMYLFERKNIHLTTDLGIAPISGDPFKMEMVINNFISNALRYTEEGKEVIIQLDEHQFSIENEGAHIPDEDLEKIWLTFHKVDKARNEEGTGLGLAICKAILDMHHFEYGVKNTQKGVLFYFQF